MLFGAEEYSSVWMEHIVFTHLSVLPVLATVNQLLWTCAQVFTGGNKWKTFHMWMCSFLLSGHHGRDVSRAETDWMWLLEGPFLPTSGVWMGSEGLINHCHPLSQSDEG